MRQEEKTETRKDVASLVFPPAAEEFLKAETGIQDSEELRKHVSYVQEETYKASPRLPTTHL